MQTRLRPTLPLVAAERAALAPQNNGHTRNGWILPHAYPAPDIRTSHAHWLLCMASDKRCAPPTWLGPLSAAIESSMRAPMSHHWQATLHRMQLNHPFPRPRKVYGRMLSLHRISCQAVRHWSPHRKFHHAAHLDKWSLRSYWSTPALHRNRLIVCQIKRPAALFV